MKYIKGLDTLRAVAVTLVIISHWGPHKFKSPALTFFFTKILPDGRFGVDLFFVLSGYLITRILLDARQKAMPGDYSTIIKSFYIRRSLRIFPIYFLFVFIAGYVFGDNYIQSHLLYFLTYTSNFLAFYDGNNGISHTWSLAVEEQFYLIWPWIIIYSPKKYLFPIILFALFTGLISSWVLDHLYGNFSTFLLLPCITAFSLGSLYAYVDVFQTHKKIVIKTVLLLLPVCIVLLLVHQIETRLILIRAVNSIIGLAGVIYISRQRYNIISGYILNNRWLVNMGKISYGIYLYHLLLPAQYLTIITFLQNKFGFKTSLFNFLTVPPSAYLIHWFLLLTVAILSYRYIESWFLKLKSRFSYSPNQSVSVNTFNEYRS